MYQLDDRLVIVTTDRQSAFDRVLAAIPYKVCPFLQTMQLHVWMHKAAHNLRTDTGPLNCIASRRAAQGQVLNQTSAWWMEATQHIVPNALLAVPDPNVSIMRKCSVFPVEFVVRGFMTGAPSSCAKRLLTAWLAG